MTDSVIERLDRALTGRYSVERELGQGGMATVYLAEDLKHRRKVALKVLRPELAAVVGAERFLGEIETTAKLQHPNILPLFDSGEADTFLFFVMPYVEGETLRDRLERERQLPVEEAVRIATEIAEALQSAHEHGVVHRDIKPANVMVTQGRPMIADFGIALALSEAGSHRLTETGLSVGTPHYLSPEQATGDQVVGPPSDVYSLGCVLYEMLVGEPPHTGKTAQAILGKVITGEPTRVTETRKAVPAHVDAVVARALEKLPADRFSAAAEFAAALRDPGFRHGAGAGPAADTRKLRFAAAAGWVAAAALGALWLFSGSEAEAPAPTRTFTLQYPDETGASEWLALTPDGSALVMADRPRSALSEFNLFVQRFDGQDRIPIPDSRSGYDPAVSPDGAWVAFGGDRIRLAPLAGGPTRTLAEGGDGGCCLRWGPDGLIYFQQREGISRVSPDGGPVEQVLAGGGEFGDVAYYQPVGDGARAIYDAADQMHDGVLHHHVEWVDVASGERHLVVEGRRPFFTPDGYLLFAREGVVYGARLDLRSMEIAAGPVSLVDEVGMTPADAMFTLSASGDLAYWIAPGEGSARPVRELIWVDRNGQAVSVDSMFTGDFESVEISPDGTRAAVTLGALDRTEIWIKDLDDGPARRLTNRPGMNRRPVWSPDGREVAFISNRDGSRAVYLVSVDGFDTPRLLFEEPGGDVDEVDWSDDGEWMIYRTGTTPGARDVYARRSASDSSGFVVSALPAIDEHGPALSPNGRWIAYVSSQTGEFEVWVRPFPDVGRGSRQISLDRGAEPVWSPEGDELFFRSRAGLVVMNVGGEADFTSGAPRVLFPNEISTPNSVHRSYGYDAERERFLMIRTLGSQGVDAELILVQNFMDEVRARLGG